MDDELKAKVAGALARLRNIRKEYSYDPEYAHGKADDVLCDLLIALECGLVVSEYNRIEKWYS